MRVARVKLEEWSTLRREVDNTRDPVVRLALAAGLTKSDIHQRTGIARTTIDRIAATSDPAAAEAINTLRLRLAGDVD